MVPDPEDGEWKVTATGLDVADGGEPIDFDVTQTQPETEPPLAIFEFSPARGAPPLRVDFDAGDSLDPADQALTYAWDFGDGSSGTGIKPAHTYGAEGEYVAKLTVTDEDGETDTFESEPIVVKSEPQPGPSDPGGRRGGLAATACRHGLLAADGQVQERPPQENRPRQAEVREGEEAQEEAESIAAAQ